MMSFPSKDEKCDFILIMYNTNVGDLITEKLMLSLNLIGGYICMPSTFTVEDNPKSYFYDAKFDEATLMDGLKRFDISTGFATFKSSGKFEYEIHFSGIKKDSGNVNFRLSDVEYSMVKEWYSLSSAMILIWKPDYAYAAPYWEQYERNEEYEKMMREKNFRKYGPDSFAIRTWLSYRLASMINIEKLKDLGADVREIEGYGFEVDLLPEPWNMDFDHLIEQREKLNTVLSDAGIKGDYTKPYLPIAGPKWKGL